MRTMGILAVAIYIHACICIYIPKTGDTVVIIAFAPFPHCRLIFNPSER